MGSDKGGQPNLLPAFTLFETIAPAKLKIRPKRAVFWLYFASFTQ
jgi:hypothetical protein